MLNEDRIKIMTKLASYEQEEGKENIKIGQYIKKDYVSYQIIKTLIGVSAAYLIVVTMWVFYQMEYLINNIQQIDLILLGKKFIAGYVVVQLIFLGISFVIYTARYKAVKRSLKGYYGNLTRLNKLYEKEQKTAGSKTVGGIIKDDEFAGF